MVNYVMQSQVKFWSEKEVLRQKVLRVYPKDR